LAFGDETSMAMAKIGIMSGSLAAGICGSMILLRSPGLSNSSAQAVPN
jgi:Na+/H+ antiporter NhaA